MLTPAQKSIQNIAVKTELFQLVVVVAVVVVVVVVVLLLLLLLLLLLFFPTGWTRPLFTRVL